ncbi:ParB N-terminal domain-containing protein [Bacillus sp. Bva_UNVM-123]|uniref:ParB/RepB/Spo0J family partition protein n=1 Tax=Bacillus sp. Bva_UNVM-123 TaxID=2829798 RepID=UPI00391FC422
MQYISINDLVPHPRNSEFFDDITGDKWEDFKKSVVRRGVVEGVVITQDLIIVSGHQRVRACKELGILEIPCRVTHYPENDPQTGNPKEDMILEDLISTNILQRGIGNVNPMKMARCIVELERIYGIRQGSAYKKPESDNITQLKTQSDFAKELGISKQQLHEYKKLNELIPEFQELVEEGKLKATTAYKIWAKLPQEEQEKFLSEVGKERISQMTQKQTDEYIKLQQKVENLSFQLEQEKNKPSKIETKVVETVKEVIPDHIKTKLNEYDKFKSEAESSKRQIEQLNNALRASLQEKVKIEKKLNELNSYDNKEKRKIEELKLKEEQLKHQAHISIFDLQIKIHNFINEASPSVFLQGAVASSSFKLKDDLLDSVIALEEFTKSLRDILDSKIEVKQSNIIDAEIL